MENKKEIGLFQIFMLFLSIYVITIMSCSIFINFSIETIKLLEIIDMIVCFIFLGDFFWQLYKSEKKLLYLKWGWIDLISSIPTIGILRWGRFFRVARILRLLRGVRSIKLLLKFMFKNKAKGTFSSVIIVAIMMMIFSSITILQVEKYDNSNIKTAEDALWWSFVTITTVGYGDYYPVSIEGRLIAAILMLIGISLFGTLAGLLSSIFFNDKSDVLVCSEDYKELLLEVKKLKEILQNK